jgi:uncharacterized protein YrrD
MTADMDAPKTATARVTAGWLASRLIHRPVVHSRLVAQTGDVVDVVFSPEGRQIVGLLVGSAGAEGGLFDLLRRILGMDFGLTFVPVERVLSLNGDMVMVDTEVGHGAEFVRPFPPISIRHLPRLRASFSFPVLTMQGQQLGRFADLQLDPEGRSITGYVVARDPATQVAPPVAAAPHASQPGAPAASQQAAPAAPAVQAASASAQAAFMIPARFRVRFGRGLIVVGEDASRPVVPSAPRGPGQSAEWPTPRWADDGRQIANLANGRAAEYPTVPPTAPDAPTEQMSPQDV